MTFKGPKLLYHFPCFLIFSFSLFIYTKTLLPTIGFWDIGEVQTVSYTLDIAHPTGFPTYLILGKIFTLIFPLGSIAWRLNFFSAVLVSGNLIFLYLSSFLLIKNRFFSTIVALNFAFGRLVWQTATHADVHNLNIFFTSLIIYLLILTYKTKNISYFYILMFLAGLSLGNHLLSLFNLPAIFFLFFLLKIKKNFFSKLILSLLFFVWGISVYLVLPIIALTKPPLTTDYSLASWQGLLRHVIAADFQNLAGLWIKGNFVDSLSFYSHAFLQQFHQLSLVFIYFGILILLKSQLILSILLLSIFFPTSLFALNYQNAAIERYFLPGFLIASLFFAASFLTIKKLPNSFAVILMFFLCFLPLNNLVKNYKIVDQSKNYAALSFAKNAFSSAKPNSLIISWWSYSTPLWYFQKVEGQRKDLEIINAGQEKWESIIQKNINKKIIYLIEPIDFNDPSLKLEKEGDLYRVK